MGLFEPHHLILILLIALIIFGPGKIADLGGALGRGLRDLKKAMHEQPPGSPAATVTAALATPVDGSRPQPNECGNAATETAQQRI